MSKHKLVRPVNLIEDTSKMHVSSQKGNHSQDDIDSVELDKLLEEITILSSNPDVPLDNHNDFRIAKEGLYVVKRFGNDMQAGMSAFKSENYKHNPFDHRLIHSLAALNEFDSKMKESKLDVRETVSLDKLNVNKTVLYKEEFNKPLPMHQNDVVQSNSNIPSQIQLNYKPSLIELVNKSTSKAPVPTSLSAPVNKTTKSSAVTEKVPNNNAGQIAALSLADLAIQHKSQRVKVGSPNEASAVAFQKVNEDMSRLSSLIANVSTPKKDSDHSCSFIHCSESENLEKLNRHNPLIVSSSSASFLDDLSRTHKLRGNNSSTLSLSNLAQQHRHSAQPLFPFSHHNSHQTDANASLTSLFEDISIKDTKSMQPHKYISTNSSSSLANLLSTEAVPDLSLALCLKNNKTSSTGSRQPLKPQQKSDTEDLTVDDNPAHVDTAPDLLCAHLQEKTTHTDLISTASSLGFVLYFFKWKGKLENSPLKFNRPLKYPQFECSVQVGDREMYAENVFHKIEPFDFSTPSPDDIVKNKQKQAFTRPDKEFEL